MSWKSFACLAAVAALSAPAVAQPSFSVDGSTLQVVVDAEGSVAVEVAISGTDIAPASADPADSLFDTPNPGDNPFTGTVTTGAFVDGNDIFISFGSDVLTPGTYDLWSFTGTGTADVNGLIAQLGVVNDGLTETITFDPVTGLRSDFNSDGMVDLIDLNILGANFGVDPPANGDANGDGMVDLVDLNILGSEFGMSAAVAVPEPASLAAAALGVVAFAVRRRV